MSHMVQRGTTLMAAANVAALASAGPDYTTPPINSFARMVGNLSGPRGQLVDNADSSNQIYIDDATDLVNSFSFARGAAAQDNTIEWELIDCDGFAPGNEVIVRGSGVVTYPTGDLTVSGPVVPGISNGDDVVVLITGQADTTGGPGQLPLGVSIASWEDTTDQPVFTRLTSGQTVLVSYVILEFTGVNWLVQYIRHDYIAGDTVEPEALPTPLGNIDQAFLHVMTGSSGTGAPANNSGGQAWIADINTISFQVHSIAASAAAAVWVIEDTSGQMLVEHLFGTVPAAFSSEIDDINIIDPAVTSIMGECGNITQIANVGMNSLACCPAITGVDEVTVSREIQTLSVDYRYSVVQWPIGVGAEPPDVDAGESLIGVVNTPIQMLVVITEGTDPNPAVLWAQILGGLGTISDDTIRNPTFTADNIGPHQFEVSVQPNDGPPVTDTVDILVVNPVDDTGDALGQINDLILQATGGPTLNEGLLTYYQSNGATSNDLQDAEYEFLIVQGAAPAALQDMWFQLFTGSGLTGSLDDMRIKYWASLI